MDIRDYGAVGDGVTDDTKSFQRAIRAALTHRPAMIPSGQPTYRTAIVTLPPGVFLLTNPIEVDLTVPSTNASDRRGLTIRGAGPASSVLLCAGPASTAVHAWHGALTLQDLCFHGAGLFGGTMLELGKQSGDDYVNQCTLERVAFRSSGSGGTMLRASWAFDSSFTDVRFEGHGPGAIGLHIPVNEKDNCNNLSFRRCHWETSTRATLLRIESLFGPRTTHTALTFDACHWETRSYASCAIEILGASRVAFTSAHVPHNNKPFGTVSGVTSADAVSPVRLVNVVGLSWTTGLLGREGLQDSFPTRLFSLGGTVRGIVMTSSYFLTADGRPVMSAADLWQEDKDRPLDPIARTRPLRTIGCVANTYDAPELPD